MQGATHSSDMAALPALHWDPATRLAIAIITIASTREPIGAGRGDGNFARMSVPLHVLRERQFPQHYFGAAR